jgi:hypothetical protein
VDKVINIGLLKHPLNWVIVVLMVLIAGIAAHFILSYASVKGLGPKSTT